MIATVGAFNTDMPRTTVSPHDPEYLRLVSVCGPHEGSVEVYQEGQWGSVCDDGWNDQDAEVVCRSLGMTGGEAVKGRGMCSSGDVIGGGIFGTGCGPIWLDGVKCLGSEENLKDCLTDPWGKHNCHHGEDAGVRCGKKMRCNISLYKLQIQESCYFHGFE